MFKLLYFFNLRYLESKMAVSSSYKTPISSQYCSNDPNYEYVIPLIIHNEDEIVNYIDRQAKTLQNSEYNKHENVLQYYLNIFDDLNDTLDKFNVRIDLDLRESNEKFIAATEQKFVCENSATVKNRNSELLEQEKKGGSGFIGFHLTTHSCLYVPEDALLMDIAEHKKCGRFVSIIWSGMIESEKLITQTILKALTGENIYDMSSIHISSKFKDELCEFVRGCFKRQKKNQEELERLPEE